MHSLVVELANEQQSEVIRQQAGLYIKVQLSAEDETIRAHKLGQWAMLDEAMKAQIKAGSMQVRVYVQVLRSVVRRCNARVLAPCCMLRYSGGYGLDGSDLFCVCGMDWFSAHLVGRFRFRLGRPRPYCTQEMLAHGG